MNPIISAALRSRRAVIFDWDGTLANTHERNFRSLCDALDPHNVTVDPECPTRAIATTRTRTVVASRLETDRVAGGPEPRSVPCGPRNTSPCKDLYLDQRCKTFNYQLTAQITAGHARSHL